MNADMLHVQKRYIGYFLIIVNIMTIMGGV